MIVEILLLTAMFAVPIASDGAWRRARDETLAQPGTPDASGTAHLRYGPNVRTFGLLVGVITPLLVAWWGLTDPSRGTSDMALALAMIAVFVAAGCYILVSARRVQARVSSWGIEATPTIGRQQRVAWADTVSVSYGALSGNLLFRGRDGTVVRVPASLLGVHFLIERMRQQLAPSLYEGAVSRALARRPVAARQRSDPSFHAGSGNDGRDGRLSVSNAAADGRNDEELTLRFGRVGLLVIAAGSAGILITMFGATYNLPREAGDGWAAAAAILVFGFLMVWPLMMIQAWARITSVGIEARRFSGRMDRVVWSQVVEARYSVLTGSLVFHGRDRERVFVPIASELENALPILRRHLRPEQFEDAVAMALRIRNRPAG